VTGSLERWRDIVALDVFIYRDSRTNSRPARVVGHRWSDLGAHGYPVGTTGSDSSGRCVSWWKNFLGGPVMPAALLRDTGGCGRGRLDRTGRNRPVISPSW